MTTGRKEHQVVAMCTAGEVNEIMEFYVIFFQNQINQFANCCKYKWPMLGISYDKLEKICKEYEDRLTKHHSNCFCMKIYENKNSWV